MSESDFRRLLPQPVLMPQREDRQTSWFDAIERAATGLPSLAMTWLSKSRLKAQVSAVTKLSGEYLRLSDAELETAIREIRVELSRKGLENEAVVVKALAVIRVVSSRTLGIYHYPCQIEGGLVLLSGRIAEMDTGEGKTLTATLAAGAAALAGKPTHVVTVNDYLAERDAELMQPLYSMLGLTVSVIKSGMEPNERRRAYCSDVTYCSKSELAFDYLRDRVALGRDAGNLRMKVARLTTSSGSRMQDVVMRGLHFAIVDEADSILIDEARTPLIIAQETQPQDERRWAKAAFELADQLEENRDFKVHYDLRRLELTAAGRKRLEQEGNRLGGLWNGRIRREESVRQALSARYLFERGDHYLVRDGTVHIVDEYSGRILEGRSWNQGLHQLVEYKEGVEVTGRKLTIARTSFQKFFRRYNRLCGMTGTAREVRNELRSVYRMNVMRVSPNRPSRRKTLTTRVLPDLVAKREAIAERARAVSDIGRPVLIGTRSVLASMELSAVLSRHGIEHKVLNAEAEAEEAGIIAEAGRAGQVTIATNMAGRGVDIGLSKGVERSGGLHVILSERHDSGRIDRQLKGRCARQGDQGSFEAILSLEDPLLTSLKSNRSWLLAALLLRISPAYAFGFAQWLTQREYSKVRKSLIKSDEQIGSMLSFVGEPE